MTKLKILFVNRMAGLVRGGGETFDLEISRALEALGCEVTYLTGAPMFGRSPLPINHPRVHCLHTPYLPWFPWDKVKSGWRLKVWEFQWFEQRAAAWIMRHQARFDLVQICELPYLVSLLKQTKIEPKIVLRLTAPNVHDVWHGIAQADSVIASGTSIAKIRTSLRQDVVDVPNGVDLERFNPGKSKYDGPPSLIYVARFQEFKNHALLIKAFKRVIAYCPDAILKLAGSGPLKSEVMRQVAAEGLQNSVIFLGEVTHADLPQIYRSAALAVISSDYESFCFAAIEAMASGLPVVTTDCGWVPKLIGDEREPVEYQWADEREDPGRYAELPDGEKMRNVPGGIVVMRGDAESLAGARGRMIRDAGLSAGGGSAYGGRDTCGAWNRAKAEREHGWESSARTLLGVYEGMVGSER